MEEVLALVLVGGPLLQRPCRHASPLLQHWYPGRVPRSNLRRSSTGRPLACTVALHPCWCCYAAGELPGSPFYLALASRGRKMKGEMNGKGNGHLRDWNLANIQFGRRTTRSACYHSNGYNKQIDAGLVPLLYVNQAKLPI